MSTCFLFTENLKEDGCLSLKLNQQGQIEAPLIHRNFAEIQALQANANTYIVDTSQHFSLHQLELPWLAERKARAAIPFALEDKLAQNFDSLHFAFDSNHYQRGTYLIVVAAKNYLQNLIDSLNKHKINFDLLTLDWFALLENEIVVMPNTLLVYDENYQGALGSDLAPFYLKKWTVEPRIYSFLDSNKKLLNGSFQGQLTEISEVSYVWLAQRLQKTRPINLCQGEFQHGSNQSNTKRLYQAAIGMCLLWLLAIIATNSIKFFILNKDQRAVDAKIAVIYREFFPQAQQIISPKFRISQLLKTNQSANDSSFWLLLNKLAKTYKNDDSISIEQLRFQNQTLTLTLVTKNFESLEDLQNKLQQNKVKVKQTQASTREGRVVGTLELNL